MPDVVLLGDINIDMVAQIPGYPVPGGEGVANSVKMHTGGSAVNTAITLARLGTDTGFIGCVGQDALAAQALSDLDEAGVDHRYVQFETAVGTGLIYVVVTADGERTMFASRGANVFTRRSELWQQYFQNTRWYHISGYALLARPQQEAALFALELAERQRCRISIDIGIELAFRHRQQVLDLLPRLDVVFPSRDELAFLAPGMTAEDSLNYLLDQGVRAVVATRGKEGCIVATRKEQLHIPSFNVNVRDTTGAGDSFNSGVILGRLVGLSWPASAVLGNATGALATSEPGAGANSIDVESVTRLLEKHLEQSGWRSWQNALEEALAFLQAIQ
ncbi:MAG: carbohydrate kinase family protein [Anaerolineae bacterium]